MEARVVAAVLGAATLGMSACGGGAEEAAPTGPARDTVDITATDFEFDPAVVKVDQAGVHAFRLVNDGGTEHALEIEGEGTEVGTERIGPGESAEIRVELAPGTYQIYCPVGNHRDMGMKGTLAVGTANPGDEAGDREEEEDQGGYRY